jgi:hypothetical protein
MDEMGFRRPGKGDRLLGVVEKHRSITAHAFEEGAIEPVLHLAVFNDHDQFSIRLWHGSRHFYLILVGARPFGDQVDF